MRLEHRRNSSVRYNGFNERAWAHRYWFLFPANAFNSIVRIMRVLVTKYVFAEDQPNIYSHTAMSWVMCGSDQKYLLNHRSEQSQLS
jgi:hypothetical protein